MTALFGGGLPWPQMKLGGGLATGPGHRQLERYHAARRGDVRKQHRMLGNQAGRAFLLSGILGQRKSSFQRGRGRESRSRPAAAIGLKGCTKKLGALIPRQSIAALSVGGKRSTWQVAIHTDTIKRKARLHSGFDSCVQGKPRFHNTTPKRRGRPVTRRLNHHQGFLPGQSRRNWSWPSFHEFPTDASRVNTLETSTLGHAPWCANHLSPLDFRKKGDDGAFSGKKKIRAVHSRARKGRDFAAEDKDVFHESGAIRMICLLIRRQWRRSVKLITGAPGRRRTKNENGQRGPLARRTKKIPGGAASDNFGECRPLRRRRSTINPGECSRHTRTKSAPVEKTGEKTRAEKPGCCGKEWEFRGVKARGEIRSRAE